MTHDEALDLVRQLLTSPDETRLMQLVSLHLPAMDSVFFSTAEASVTQLEREGKPSIAAALRALTDRALRLKTLI